MRQDSEGRNRRSIRGRRWDYASAGSYFVTLCTWQREVLFGEFIEDGLMRLNACGEIVENEWCRTADVRPGVSLDVFVVMPNHLHGIIILDTRPQARRVEPTPSGRPTGASSGSLGAIIGQFKSVTTKRINALRGTPGASVWQRSYYDHLIRDEDDFLRVRRYIAANPFTWHEDDNNPAFI
jgi:REP element-mobilizing transposase RayT